VSEPLRVLIVDDEPLARRLVRHLLEDDPEVTVVGACSGADAVTTVASTRPDIMFLDVQMPEVDGFGVLDDIGVDRAPIVVFVTAYSDHALRAFEVHAIDYLLKPIDDARFTAALDHAKQQARARRRGEIDERLGALMRERPPYPRGFLVRTRDKTLVVATYDIDWIEAADYYVSIHVGGASHLLRETMSELERRLDPERFFRVHRSAIVNVDRVREIHPLFRGDCELALSDGTRVRLSRTRRGEFERLFSAPADGA
jgi:two-component system LytT family response regulator